MSIVRGSLGKKKKRKEKKKLPALSLPVLPSEMAVGILLFLNIPGKLDQTSPFYASLPAPPPPPFSLTEAAPYWKRTI
jgi:hypothetical protein